MSLIYTIMVNNPIEKKPKEVWLVRCSQGHEFYTDYLPEIVNKETGDFECSKCVAEKKTSYISLISEPCATGNCLACPDNDLLECSCFCHEDQDYILQLIAELEKDVEF